MNEKESMKEIHEIRAKIHKESETMERAEWIRKINCESNAMIKELNLNIMKRYQKVT